MSLTAIKTEKSGLYVGSIRQVTKRLYIRSVRTTYTGPERKQYTLERVRACVRVCDRAIVYAWGRASNNDTAKTKRTCVTVHCVGRRRNRGNVACRCCLQTYSGRRRSVPPSAPLATVDRNVNARKHIFQTSQSSTVWPLIHNPYLQRKRNRFVLRCYYSFKFHSPKIQIFYSKFHSSIIVITSSKLIFVAVYILIQFY